MSNSVPERLDKLEAKVAMILKILQDMADKARCGCCTEDLERSLHEILKADIPPGS